MPNPLIFLGAGASAPFGVPTMKELVISFENELRNDPSETSSRELALYSSVTQTLKEGFDYVDLESVFSVIESIATDERISNLGFASAYLLHRKGVNLTKGLAASTEEQETAKLLLERFQRHVRMKCAVADSELNHIDSVYSRFSAVLSQKFGGSKMILDGKDYWIGDWAVYTTNYDTIFEKYAEGVFKINDLFVDQGTLHSVLETSKVNEGGYKLIKLHGSVDWFRLSDGRVIRNPTQPKFVGRRQVEGEEMLYPIQQKDLYLYPWYDMFGGLKRDLILASHWIIIGYSFNDEFIADVFRQAMIANQHKIVYVHPEGDGIWNRKFMNLANHARILRSKFGDESTYDEITGALRAVG